MGRNEGERFNLRFPVIELAETRPVVLAHEHLVGGEDDVEFGRACGVAALDLRDKGWEGHGEWVLR